MQYLPGALDTSDNIAEQNVWDYLVTNFLEVPGVCGYRIPSVGATDDSFVPSFVLITPSRGVILIDVIDDAILGTASTEMWKADGRQIPSRDLIVDNFWSDIENRLNKDQVLFDRKSHFLSVPKEKLLVFYRNTSNEVDELRTALDLLNPAASKDDWQEQIADLLKAAAVAPALDDDKFDRVVSNLDGTNALLQTKFQTTTNQPVTKQDFLDTSRAKIFKLDEEQRQISFQLPNGPQRIRGLAGTGKTVILSLKAALTHKSRPDFRVLYLFNTKSLYDIVRSHINKYFIPETKREPNWAKIDVLHAWGGASLRGLYSEICRLHGIKPLTYDDIKDVRDQISYLYNHLLEACDGRFEQIYDLCLIDEAQDFPPPVFEVIYKITKSPKRIVWAYDEFQALSDIRMREPEELFGIGPSGQPNISSDMLRGYYSKTVKKDFVLPNSYRTSRVALMVAHGIALGIKSKIGFVDMIDDRATWHALGYTILRPEYKNRFSKGDAMDITRLEKNSRNILESTLRKFDRPDSDLISICSFDKDADEIAVVAAKIHSLIFEERIKPEEIMVITIDVRRSRSKLTKLRQALSGMGVNSVTPGIYERAEIFRSEGSVTLVSPFRAKGNESDIVFVLDAQEAMRDVTFRARNFLFVSITRARGWCFVSGTGRYMEALATEMKDVLDDYPNFRFEFPDDSDIKRRRLIMSVPDDSTRAAQATLDKIFQENPELFDEFYRQRRELFAE